jgi:O-methyltransferase
MNFIRQWVEKRFPKFLNLTRMMRYPDRYVVWSQGWGDKPQYNQDGLATAHNCDFLKDELFMESYRLGEATGSWDGSQPIYRAYIAAWAGGRAKSLQGDFVECGVNRGALSRMIINYVHFEQLPKTFYLLDTYQGLAATKLSDLEKERHVDRYPDCYADVVATFSPFKNVKIIKGTVPETLSEVKSEQIAYLSIDMNCVGPEIAAIEYFWNKMVPGGLILLDDYGFDGHLDQKMAHDAFAKSRGVSVLTLPTGQGLIIK